MKKLVKLIFFVSIVSLSINLPTYANVKDSLGKITEKFKPKIFQTSGSKEFETISKYSLKDILDYQESHLKSGVLSYRFKEYNFWTIKDNLSLDGKESTLVAKFFFLKQLFSSIIFLSPEKEIDIKVFELLWDKPSCS